MAVSFYDGDGAPLFDRRHLHMPRLTRLELDPSTDLLKRLAGWPGLANLVELGLNDSFDATEPAAAAKLFASPHLTPRLARLGASGICKSAKAVAALAGCRALVGLTHLDFAFNELTPNSAAALAASPHLKHLRSLHTWSEWDQHGERPWLRLAEPAAFPRLRDLVVGSGTDEAVQQELHRRFGPRLRVFSDC